jgi:hypothetical protein
MLKHIVLFKLKEHAEGAGKAENARRVKEALESLAKKIPQVRDLEVGINIIPSDAAYDVALITEFADENDLALYIHHPEHVKVAEFVGKVREGRVVVDYIV